MKGLEFLVPMGTFMFFCLGTLGKRTCKKWHKDGIFLKFCKPQILKDNNLKTTSKNAGHFESFLLDVVFFFGKFVGVQQIYAGETLFVHLR